MSGFTEGTTEDTDNGRESSATFSEIRSDEFQLILLVRHLQSSLGLEPPQPDVCEPASTSTFAGRLLKGVADLFLLKTLVKIATKVNWQTMQNIVEILMTALL